MAETPPEPTILEAALQRVAEGIVVVDRAGRLLFCNEAARRIFGADDPEASPHHPFEQLPLARAMRGEAIHGGELLVRSPSHPQGAWVSVDCSPLRDERGELAGGVIVFRDVTAHRRSHEVLRQLSKAVEKTTDSVFVTDTDAVIQYVNPAFETTTGYAREEAVGRRASLLKSGLNDPGYYEEQWRRILAGEVHSGTLVNRRKNGELFHAEQTITPVSDDAGRITNFVSVMRDVTELKKAQVREVEMRLARVVQQRLYPACSPELPGFDLAGATFPADHTCGDYYDFLPAPDGRVGIAVGDVSGHGFGAALLMAETRAFLRSLARSATDLRDILAQLNLLLCQDTDDERFVTLMLTLLDPGRRSIVYSSAGHIQGFVLDRAGDTRHVLGPTGPPLGLFDESAFESSPEIPLAPGDLVLLLTDGAAEAQDPSGAFFETERVLRVVAEARQRSSAQVVERLRAAVEEFAQESPQRDDITVVVCRVTSPP
jgi:PAS domain S-box-containing protein